MRFVAFLGLLILISCKRKHSNVLVQVQDNDTSIPVANSKVEVIRKGKEGFFIDKKSLVVGEGVTNSNGEVLINFRYDRGNKYALLVYPGYGYFQNYSYQCFDLEKGGNKEIVKMDQLAFVKLNLKSTYPNSKLLTIKIDDFANVYNSYFYNHTSSIDTTVFCYVSSTKGNKNITWKVDSDGVYKNYSQPIQLKGHDTTFTTIIF